MGVSIQITSLLSAGTAYVFSDPASANGNTANALEMVKTAQLMVDSAAMKMQACLEALNAALAELAALSPPKPGEDGKVDQAAQQAYEQALNAAKAKVGKANQELYKANFEYRTAVEALDRANMMLPVAQERDAAQQRAFEDSKKMVEEAQKRIDEAMRQALESAKAVEKSQPNEYWAWDAIRSVARDVGQGDMRLAQYLDGKKARQDIKTVEQQRAAAGQSQAVFGGTATIPNTAAPKTDSYAGTTATPKKQAQKKLNNVPRKTGLNVSDNAQVGIATRGKTIEALLRKGTLTADAAKFQDWKALGGAPNAGALVQLLTGAVNNAATDAERAVWQSALNGVRSGQRVEGSASA